MLLAEFATLWSRYRVDSINDLPNQGPSLLGSTIQRSGWYQLQTSTGAHIHLSSSISVVFSADERNPFHARALIIAGRAESGHSDQQYNRSVGSIGPGVSLRVDV